MPVLRDRSNRAIFDLGHLDTLSDVQGLTLLLSPRTLYVLQNLVVADVTDRNRYAAIILESGWYITPEEDSEDWQTMLDVIEGVEEEVYVMSGIWPVAAVLIDEIDTYVTGTTGTIDIVVPEGKLWEFQGISLMDEQHSCQVRVTTRDISSGETCFIAYNDNLSAAVWYPISFNASMLYGQRLRCSFFNCTDLDHIYVKYHVLEYEV